ncbi:hypothetical protein PMAYCL1PPCAC_25697, partial [Pristionchus mayeri]
LIHSRAMTLEDSMVSYILKLADRFQVETLLNECENRLIQSTGFDLDTKKLLASECRLTALKKSLLSIDDLHPKNIVQILSLLGTFDRWRMRLNRNLKTIVESLDPPYMPRLKIVSCAANQVRADGSTLRAPPDPTSPDQVMFGLEA